MREILITLLLIGLPLSDLMAQKNVNDSPFQDGAVGIFDSREEYNQFIGSAKDAAYGPNGTPEMQAMIPMLNDIALDKPVGWTATEYGDTGSTLGILSDTNIRRDIEMMDGQYQELQQRSAEVQKNAAQKLRRLDFKNTENLLEQIQNIRDQANSELSTVLLPHQIERLQQIQMQSQLRRRSLVDLLTSDPLKSKLEISDSQSDALRDEAAKIEADLAQQIAKLRERARDRLLSKLNLRQQQEVKDMLGDRYEFVEKPKSNPKR